MVGRVAAWLTVPALLLAALVVGIAINLTSCSRSVRPPADVEDPVVVTIAEYGKHASLLLPAPHARLVEWSWGDWNYFALNRTGVRWGAQAIFWSESATLARREFADPGDSERLRAELGATQLIGLPVERRRADALLAALEARYERNRASEVWNPVAGRHFVRDDEGRYWMLNTSAHEVSRWLRALDVDVRGVGLLGEFTPAESSTARVVAGSDARPAAADLLP
jgi:hypothetical protein